jgi:hypothetical protein
MLTVAKYARAFDCLAHTTSKGQPVESVLLTALLLSGVERQLPPVCRDKEQKKEHGPWDT